MPIKMNKKLLFAFALFFCAQVVAWSQHSYIECSGDIFLLDGAIDQYKSPNIVADARYSTLREVWVITLSVLDSGLAVDSAPSVRTQEITLDFTTVDAITPSGSTTSEKMQNAILQAVKTYLEGLNGGATFTLH